MTTNQIAYWKNQEDIRSHQANEALTRDANRIKQLEAEVKRAEADEKRRHNRVMEKYDSSRLLNEDLYGGAKAYNEGVSNAIDFISLFKGFFKK